MMESEYGVIGCILTDSHVLYEIYNQLEPNMFADQFCRECYAQMLAMYDLGEAINHVGLVGRLENANRDREEVNKLLIQCVTTAMTSAMVKSYAEDVEKSYKAREVRKVMERVSLLPVNVDTTIAELISRCEELAEKRQSKSKTLADIVDENRENYFVDCEKDVIRSGFPKLDDCLGGLEAGDVIVIGARPGIGKSAIAVQVIHNVCASGRKVGYYNLEMTDKQVYERMISHLSGISLTRVRRAKYFLRGEKENFDRANDRLKKLNLTISSGSKSVSEIRAESRHQKYDLIVIDYLQLIRTDRKFGNRSSEVGDISKAIKALAMELGIPIILLSQMNRTSEVRETKEPTMAELRESGDIEQDASVIILLWSLAEEDTSLKGMKVDKNRQGELMKTGLLFHGDKMQFEELQEEFKQTLQRAKAAEKQSSLWEECPFTKGEYGEKV